MTTPYGTSGSLTSGYHVPNISPLLQFHGKVYLLVKESLNLGVQMHSPEIIAVSRTAVQQYELTA